MTTAMQIGKTARDRADFCRCFKTGAAVFLHDDGIVAHATYRNTLRAAYMLVRTNCDTRGCKHFGIRMRWLCTPDLYPFACAFRSPLAKGINDAWGHVGDNRPKRRRREALFNAARHRESYSPRAKHG